MKNGLKFGYRVGAGRIEGIEMKNGLEWEKPQKMSRNESGNRKYTFLKKVCEESLPNTSQTAQATKR